MGELPGDSSSRAARSAAEAPLVTVWPGGRRRLGDDPNFGPWVRKIGAIRVPAAAEAPFPYLARAICFQQLAGKAARAIHGRFVQALDGDVTPDRVLRTGETKLRAAGLSRAKAGAIRDLASKIESGAVGVGDLHERSDEEVVRRLTLVWGIGEWTAQMYLIFRLHRPDVWPSGDLGVRAGYAKVHGLTEPLSAGDLKPLGDAYRPWRSAAAWYCYRVLETEAP